VYRAQLWVDPGFSASTYDEHAFALTLNYQRALQGRAIAERSIQEIKRQVPIDAEQETRWLAAMGATFPNVQEHDRLTGLHQPGSAARLLVQWACTRYAVGCKLQCPLFSASGCIRPPVNQPLRLALLAGVTRLGNGVAMTSLLTWQNGWRYGLMGAPLAFVALPLYVLLPNHYAREFGVPLASLGATLLAVRPGRHGD
jgi:hypothetical protein